eukprot:TRINITY_DN624_c0_g1_i1.p1 TRINITY_DN624_c0_g1~~TRINITY_DN624_c0_g1_i1.p1  ORF type:complete len:142 (-),score=7.37 TRINITY_DN624_c0_g1_i1:62-487(-)
MLPRANHLLSTMGKSIIRSTLQPQKQFSVTAFNRRDEKRVLRAKQTYNDNPFDTYVVKPEAGEGLLKSVPIIVPSTRDSRMIGCCCEDDYDEVVWFELKKGATQQCECGCYFRLVDHDPMDQNIKATFGRGFGSGYGSIYY